MVPFTDMLVTYPVLCFSFRDPTSANTGNYHMPLPVQEGPVETAEDQRCGGCASASEMGNPWVWTGLGLVCLLRRRESKGDAA